jgi:hypothetical protein
MTPLPHDITEQDNDKYECRICAQIWTIRPVSDCPGLKVYPKDDYASLMSIRQLNANGYQTIQKFLPPPVGCYRVRFSENYIMLYDPAQAAKRVNRSRPMTAHDLVKSGRGAYECRACFKKWDKRPQTACPGVRIYERYDYAPLMTRDELDYIGYQATPKSLPPEAGCFYHPSAAHYILLYDPIQATPKTRLRGVHNTVTEIVWPLNCLSLLTILSEMGPFRTLSPLQREQTQQLFTEISNIAALTGVYTRMELEQITGGVIVFTLPPTILYRFYPIQRANIDDERKLQTNLLIAYRRYMSLSQGLS